MAWCGRPGLLRVARGLKRLTHALPPQPHNNRCPPQPSPRVLRVASSRRVLRVEQEIHERVRVLVSTAAPVCMRLTRHALTHHTFSPLSLCPTADLSAAQPRSTITMPGGGDGKTRIGDLELASIPPKYGPYLALPAGPEPAVWRLAPKTGHLAPTQMPTQMPSD